MTTLERRKEILKFKITSMKIKRMQAKRIDDLTSLILHGTVIECGIKMAKRDLREACESEFKDDPGVVRQINELGPLISEVERLYEQKQVYIPA